MNLSDLQAAQFALMILAGIPPAEAVTYFVPEDTDPKQVAVYAAKWPKNNKVIQEIKRLQGGVDWLGMSDETRMELALKKHYAEMAFYLYSHNYGDLSGPDKSKADICREALEKKLAGKSGQSDPIAELYEKILAKSKAESKLAPQAKVVTSFVSE